VNFFSVYGHEGKHVVDTPSLGLPADERIRCVECCVQSDRGLNFQHRSSKGAIMNLKILLVSFDGRINRAKFWLAMLIFVGFGIAVGIVSGILMAISFYVGIAFYAIAAIIGLIAGVAVGVKRLHDRGKSGLWLVLFYLVPIALQAIALFSGSETIGTLLYLIASAISIWMIVELGCLRGTVGPNKYGRDPLEAGAAATA
jgi:uncharacterized membrane protein YhaH (DUF805 family)